MQLFLHDSSIFHVDLLEFYEHDSQLYLHGFIGNSFGLSFCLGAWEAHIPNQYSAAFKPSGSR